jgi:ubiquinone/menaquinone biosynthesis C-methylase UbiE
MPDPIIATKQDIEEIFDGAAIRYDHEGPSVFTQFGTHLVDLLNVMGGERILDVATGKGAVLIPCAERVGRFGHVVGIDLAQNMLEQAEDAARAAGLDNFELYKMDAEHLEFRDQIFDMVTCAFSLFFFPSMDTALREMDRVLVPGGRIGIALFGDTPPFEPAWGIFAEQARAYGVAVRTPQRVVYSPEQAQALLRGVGFQTIETSVEKYDVVYDDFEEWWAFQFTLGNRAALMRMDDATRARFREEYRVKLQSLFRDDGLHLSVSVVYALARKSTK